MWHKYVNRDRAKEVVELRERLDLCNNYKSEINKFAQEVEQAYKDRTINADEYYSRINERFGGKSYEYWINYYDDFANRYKERINEIENVGRRPKKPIIDFNKKTFNILAFMIIMVFVLILARPNITGFITTEIGEGNIISTVSYGTEGLEWSDVRGDGIYERCLAVSADNGFNTATVSAKVGITNSDANLRYALRYDSQGSPGSEIGSCTVADYTPNFKSCDIELSETTEPGDYWLCAAVDGGQTDITYYLIGFHVGDNSESAFWTGKTWQKLERSSYTIKADLTE